ncbi:MAG: MBL fold metallo-hydrolase [Mycobacteriales bacterium]
MNVRVDKVVTSGVFSLDGQDFEVENNVWLVGDDSDVVVVDAAHDAGPILDEVGDRRVRTIVCTHGHNDHINAVADLADATRAPVALHPADRMLWDVVLPDRAPDIDLSDGTQIAVAGVGLQVMHTPGHSPGAICLYTPELRCVFAGDTLFAGGPGATGRSYSDFGTIVESIRDRLFTLPSATVVHTGHGEDTTIGAETSHLKEWIARGH